MSHFSDLLSALARELNLEADLDDSHVALEFGENLYDFYYDADTERMLVIAMVADLGEAPSTQRQTLIFKQLMKAQFCFAQTTGFTFALSNDEEFIALQALWDVPNLSEQDFIGRFEKFVQTVRLWSNKLQADLETAEPEAFSAGTLDCFDYIRG